MTRNSAKQHVRAINLQHDYYKNLKSYVCSDSTKQVFEAIAEGVSAGQYAFTVTGSYGVGKSSACVLLSGLVGNDAGMKKHARTLLGAKDADNLIAKIGGKKAIIPVVGYKNGLAKDILETARLSNKKADSIQDVVDLLEKTINKKTDGALIIIDEAGQQFENCERIYDFQALAESINIYQGKIIILLVLHQSFVGYAQSPNIVVQAEWKKVSGRYQDIPFQLSQKEQMELIANHIGHEHSQKHSLLISPLIKKIISTPEERSFYTKALGRCYPLDPLVAVLLCFLPQTGYGQLQRSLFNFLESGEQYGLRWFMAKTRSSKRDSLYTADIFWDYLSANYHSSLLSYPFGYRFSICLEALDRARSISNNLTSEDITVLKAICAASLFRTGGRTISEELVQNRKDWKKAVARLLKQSLIVYRAYSDAYVPYGGSDFNLDEKLPTAENNCDINTILSFIHGYFGQDITHPRKFNYKYGTRHYFKIVVCGEENAFDLINDVANEEGALGCIMLVFTDNKNAAHEISREIAAHARNKKVAIVLKPILFSDKIYAVARRYAALERIRTSGEISNDNVATREVELSLSYCQNELSASIEEGLEKSGWFINTKEAELSDGWSINNLASEALERLMKKKCPTIQSELLCVKKASSSASSAALELMRRMITDGDKKALGIDKFPAHYGLYEHILRASKLHRENESGQWEFVNIEGDADDDPNNLRHAWSACSTLLRKQKGYVPVADIYKIWGGIPYGIMPGVMPVLLLAYILGKSDTITVRYDGQILTQIEEHQAEVLWRGPAHFELMEVTEQDFAYLNQYIDALDLKSDETVLGLARYIYKTIKDLPETSKNCDHLMNFTTRRIRNVILAARDQNQLLFTDLPRVIGQKHTAPNALKKALDELSKYQETVLSHLEETLLKTLDLKHDKNRNDLLTKCQLVSEQGYDYVLSSFARSIYEYYSGKNNDFSLVVTALIGKDSMQWRNEDLLKAKDTMAQAAKNLRSRMIGLQANGKSTVRFSYHSKQQHFDHEPLISNTDKQQVERVEKELSALSDNYGKDNLLAAIVKYGSHLEK